MSYPLNQSIGPEHSPLLAQQEVAGIKAASDENWYLADSELHGTGIFAGKNYEAGEVVAVAATEGGNDEWGSKIWNLTTASRYCNHQSHTNVTIDQDGLGKFMLVTTKPVEEDDEFFANYRDITKKFGRRVRVLWDGVDIPTSDLEDFIELEKESEYRLEDQTFSDSNGSYNVADLYELAKAKGKPQNLQISDLLHNLEPSPEEEGEELPGHPDFVSRAEAAGDLPGVVVNYPDGKWVADGVHRLWKANHDKKLEFPAYLLEQSDLADLLQQKVAADLQGFIDRAELMGSRGRALKYGRPEPEGRDYDRVVFTDDAEDQQALMQNLREVAEIKGYKQHERPDGFLTISGDNQDLSVYPTSKRDKIYNAWELIEGGMSKDEAWDQIAKEAKDKAVLVTGNPKYIENNPEADAYYQAVEDYLAEQGYSVSRDVGEPYTEPAPADVWLGHSRGVDRLRFAPEGTQTLAFGSGVEGAINHPEDLSLKAEDVPTSAHYQFTDEMKQAITALRAQKQQKEAKDKVEFVHSCCGEPSGKCAGCSEGSVLLPKDEYEKAGDRSSRDKADS